MVDVEYVDTLPHLVSLDDLKSAPGLEDMVVTKRSRLSVQPVRPEEHEIVVRIGRGS
jgi:predicted RNA-binding protein with PUA-like domain